MVLFFQIAILPACLLGEPHLGLGGSLLPTVLTVGSTARCQTCTSFACLDQAEGTCTQAPTLCRSKCHMQ